MGLSTTHLLLMLLVVVLLFGRGKVSDLMGDVAKGIKSFKKGMADDEAPPAPGTPKTIDQNGQTVSQQRDPAKSN
jgi:sec-independent protein translocase protein TatA